MSPGLGLCRSNWLGGGEGAGPFHQGRERRQELQVAPHGKLREGNGDRHVQQRGPGCRNPGLGFLQAAEHRAALDLALRFSKTVRLVTPGSSLSPGCSQPAATPTHGGYALARERAGALPCRQPQPLRTGEGRAWLQRSALEGRRGIWLTGTFPTRVWPRWSPHGPTLCRRAVRAAACRGHRQMVLTSGQTQGSADALGQQQGHTSPSPPSIYQGWWPGDIQDCPSFQRDPTGRLRRGPPWVP